MENLRSNANNITNYPSKETMELFLELGKITGILSKGIDGYKNINAVITLAVVCDYLCQEGNEQKKQIFLEELKKQGDKYYKIIGELALDIREKKGNLTPFSKSMIESNREALQDTDPSTPYFPVIGKSDFPGRIEKIEYTRMIHEEFEAELARIKGTKEGADQIQQETEKHTFDRGNNEPEIKNLEDRL